MKHVLPKLNPHCLQKIIRRMFENLKYIYKIIVLKK